MSKRKNKKYRFLFCLILLFFVLGFLFFCLRHNFYRPRDLLGKPQESSSKLWRPLESSDFQNPILEIDAQAALSCDFSTGEIFFAKNLHQRLPTASLTKVMTAVVVLDLAAPEKVLEVPSVVEDLPEDSSYMGVDPGEKYTILDLLYGLLLPSGNDAATAFSYGLTGGKPELFVYWMNRKAKALGLKNTNFSNSSGLDDLKNYSSVYDLGILSHYAVSHYPLLQEIVASRSYEIPYTEEHKYLFFGNFNDLMLAYKGVDGIKPGNTVEAGSCLIATATQEGKRVMSVVLGSSARNLPTIKLLDLGFENLGVLP